MKTKKGSSKTGSRASSDKRTRVTGTRKRTKRGATGRTTRKAESAKGAMSRGSKSKATRSVQPRRPKKATASRRTVSASDRRHVQIALKMMNEAQRIASARGRDLLALAQDLGTTAVEAKLDALVKELVAEELLRDIAALQAAFDAHADGGLPKEFESVRLFPTAIIQWLGEVFDLALHRRVGDQFETPTDQLKKFEVVGDLPRDDGSLVPLKVRASGWKRKRAQLIPPLVEITSVSKSPKLS